VSAHHPAGRWTPDGRQTNGPRVPSSGAQGVRVWYRELSGRMFLFTLVEAGWWGTAPTGTLTVSARISNGDWYPIHRFTPNA
jgi:hypothetical protein